MSERERCVFDTKLAIHTAPTLMGIKCANLFSMSLTPELAEDYLADFQERSGHNGLRIRAVCHCGERVLLYVYHERLLSTWLSREDVQAFLRQYGYTPEMTLDEMLRILGSRITCGSFPHEIGVFLGYPLEDIRGFIENEGRNCLLCGVWKVYSDPESAQQKFQIYGRCREILCDKLHQGLDIFQALKCSKEELS
ncbi:MAG: DUF3793 family protein [Oscillospiraceae bacterium]|nr:DUF3793 family protein [Oscillospiraceae bacterium]